MRFRRLSAEPLGDSEINIEIDVQFNGPCVFCGELIADSAVDPCKLTVETSSGLWQVWFCHGSCFRERIAENPHVDLSAAHF